MPRCAAAGRTTNAPTSTLPGISLYSIANVRLKVKEIHLFNTTTTACTASVVRLTTTGTQGTGLTEICEDNDGFAPAGTAFQSHTSTPPTSGSPIRYVDIAAGIGAGVILTFSDAGLVIPAGTGNGIGILCPSGTGQVLDVSFVWDE